MTRILHTSDLLLGLGFPHCHTVADQLRAARLETLRSLLALAKREKVDAVIISGNLWADNRVGQPLVSAAAQLLSKSTVPVYLLPGQLDPMTPDSPYQLYADLFVGKVHLMMTREPLVLGQGLVLYPCPVDFRGASGDPTRWIPDRGKERLRIAVTCTDPEGYRLPPSSLDTRDLDLILAGGRTSRVQEAGVSYPGTPEPTDFGQSSGNVTLVSLSPESGAQAESREVAGLTWAEETADANDLEGLTKRWSQDENRSTTLLRLTLQGQVQNEALAGLANLRRTLESKLLHLQLRDELLPAADLHFRHPLLRSVAGSLLARAASPFKHDPTSLSPDDAEVAREALTKLTRLLDSAEHRDLV